MSHTDKDIPQWATQRASDLTERECGTGSIWNGLTRAFARYIAEHEEPPVDPLLIEAREIVAKYCDDLGGFPANVIRDTLDGQRDDFMAVECALAALKSREAQS